MSSNKRIAIIGGGASGIFAAIGAEKSARELSASIDIDIFEAGKSIGKPILRAGNGRCNLSNTSISNDRALSLLKSRGLLVEAKESGEIFPYTNRAASVLELCGELLDEYNINVLCNSPINSLCELSDYEAVIVCTGHHTKKTLLPKNTKFQDFKPVLCPIEVEGRELTGLENLRAKATLSVKSKNGELKFKEFGEVQFRKYGLSGIVVFNASRFAEAGDTLELDFKPLNMSDEDFVDALSRRFDVSRNCQNLLSGIVDLKIEELILSRCKEVTREEVLKNLRALFFSVKKNHEDPKTVQVYRGGVEISQICGTFLKNDFVDKAQKNCNVSQIIEVCGEAQDFDGPCGGFNISHAFNSGLAAGRDAVLRLTSGGSNFESVICDLKSGKAVGIPTDTVYGVGVSVLHCSSPATVNKLKQRDVNKPIAWLISDKNDMEIYCEDIPDYAYKLAEDGWPGGLTLILNASEKAPKNYVAHDGSVAIRLPDCELTRKVIKEVGSPLATSSANFSGELPSANFFDCDKDFLKLLDNWLIDESCSKNSGVASTIIDCRESEPVILRQ